MRDIEIELPERTSTTIADVANKADALVKWLDQSLSINANNSRIGIYSKQVRKLTELLEQKRFSEADKDTVAYHRAILELHEFFLPFDSYNSTSEVPGLAELLKTSVGGPVDRFSQNDTKSASRNHFFEVQVGARLHRIGLEVCYPESSPVNGDVETTINSHKIVIQCKRISSIKRIEQRVREGINQLKTHLTVYPQSYGMVAIDISKTVNSNYECLIVEDQSHAHEEMTRMMDNFKSEHLEPLAHKIILANKQCIGQCIGLIVYSGQLYHDRNIDARAHMPAYGLFYFWPDCDEGMRILDRIESVKST